MKHVLAACALAAALSIPAFAEESQPLQWNGNLVTRYRIFDYDDQLNSVNNAAENKNISKQHQRVWDIRASVLAKAQGPAWEAGIGLRTTNAIVNDFLTFNGSGDLNVRADYAYGKYLIKAEGSEHSLTFGRQGTIIMYDKLAQHLYDNDVRWDGLSYGGRFGSFGVVAGAFVYGANSLGGATGASTYTYTEASQASPTTQSRFAMHYAIQPNATFKLADEVETTVAVGYYAWSNTNGLTNTVHGGYNSVTLNPNADTGTINIDNSRMLHLYNLWKLPFALRATIEYTLNKKFLYTHNGVEADRDSYLFGLGYGGLKEPGNFALDYFYNDKGLASMPGNFVNGGVRPDNKGHLIYGRLLATKGITLGAVAYFLREKAQKNSVGTFSRVNQKQKQFYFTASAVF